MGSPAALAQDVHGEAAESLVVSLTEQGDDPSGALGIEQFRDLFLDRVRLVAVRCWWLLDGHGDLPLVCS